MTLEPTARDATVAADYEALRRGVGAYLHVRAVVTVAGPDAQTYLQGQLSQDIAPLGIGQSTASLLLEPDGKIAALLRATRSSEDAYLLDTDAGFGDAVSSRLTRFRLRTKVEIEAAEWPCVALRGAGVELPAALGDTSGGPPWYASVDWNGTRGMDILGHGAEARVPGKVHWCSAEAWEALRVEAGIPKMGAELDTRTIAAEAGLVERTVSFTKGCYTGQELVARLDARGSRVARRLCGVIAGGLGSADAGQLVGATLHAPGADRAAGQCTSASWSPAFAAPIALAYVHRSIEVPASLLVELGDDHATAEVQVRPLPLAGG